MQKKWISFSFIALSILSGCTTAGNAIPEGGPTMAQVYEEAMQKSNSSSLDAAREEITSPINLNTKQAQLSDYTRNSENEVNNLFPTLPNPQVVMYVYPHLADKDEAPVPGYSTAFFLYNNTHYALPGEIA